MHFDTAYYVDNHVKTLKCMEETRMNIVVSDSDASPLMQVVRVCVLQCVLQCGLHCVLHCVALCATVRCSV